MLTFIFSNLMSVYSCFVSSSVFFIFLSAPPFTLLLLLFLCFFIHFDLQYDRKKFIFVASNLTFNSLLEHPVCLSIYVCVVGIALDTRRIDKVEEVCNVAIKAGKSDLLGYTFNLCQSARNIRPRYVRTYSSALCIVLCGVLTVLTLLYSTLLYSTTLFCTLLFCIVLWVIVLHGYTSSCFSNQSI